MPRIEIYGSSVEYHEQGSGTPVVLLHSSGSSGAQWRALAGRLATQYRVLTPDLIGYGGTSTWKARSGFCLAQEAALVRSLLGRLGEPAHLVGHSYGGAVALHVARTRPELVRSLTVIEPVAFHLLRDGDEIDGAALREISEIATLVSVAVERGDYGGGSGAFVDYWSGPGAWAAMPARTRAALASLLPKVALDFHATINEPAGLEDMRDIAARTLILQGGCTAVPTRRICKRLAGVLPAVHVKTIKGAGHMAPVTHRDEVNDLIVAYLDANAAERRSAGAMLVA